ncbi:DUF4391 domain-containing protein [Methylocystis parvus]|uniref:DUF4391 domain-containing protein n=1 Tax=Methylocystis parvus TaxID=134 RepID=A0A6B8M1S0_9HYPH|nr:DUF4391 domain-containing protein [Methylocystis parvus]QGM96245.1 DUF4391 domain-containing protein [Methylocystis parvus]WBJ99923.1 DUF4391 domain-containing protein [Methylocystis parvus OBBP]
MTAESGILAIVDALGLPPDARVDARVPKKLLVEQGAPTSADKRAIQDGIDELQWLAACKPTTIGVPSFADETREYLEIAVVACAFRPGAKAARLIELIHRAIPYPVALITSDADSLAVSVAHKRHAQNEAGKVVIERVVSASLRQMEQLPPDEQAFMASLALAEQPRHDLFTLYEGWLARIEALNAARVAGPFRVADDVASIERRRLALDEHTRLSREVTHLKSKAAGAKQISQRVELNQKIKTIESAIDRNKKVLLGD